MFKTYYDFLDEHIQSQASAKKTTNPGLVEHGYGQLEPNRLSAQYTGQIYGQLPAAAGIDILEQGQFVKYDYAHRDASGANSGAAGIGECNFTGAGEWMLVYNETKLYREEQRDCEFAMLKGNYGARVYSPYDAGIPEILEKDAGSPQSRYYNGNHGTYTVPGTNPAVTYPEGVTYDGNGNIVLNGVSLPANEDVTSDVNDYFVLNQTSDPFHIVTRYPDGKTYKEKMMPAGTTMVPRVFKTNIGDIITLNLVMVKKDVVAVGDLLCPNPANKGILTPVAQTDAASAEMLWQVVKVYTMPDNQPGVKIMRIK